MMNEGDNKTVTKSKQVKLAFVTGAGIFLAVVLYFNLTSELKMNYRDWLVVAIGVLFFTITFALYIRDKS